MLDTNSQAGTAAPPARNAAELIQQLKDAGEPIVLAINGKVELAVEDATSLWKLLELVDRLEAIEAIREGMKQIDEGQGVSLEGFKDLVRKKHGIPL